MMVALHRAARYRLARLRGEHTAADGGYALIFVLVITMLITLGVASALAVTASNIVPAKRGQDEVAALAAAQAGLENYVAYLNANCATFDGTACGSITGTAIDGSVHGTDNAGAESYHLQVMNPSSYLTDGFLRVKSTGRSAVAGDAATKTLVADLAGLPGVLRFAYLSKYETLAKSFVDSYYPARSVAISDSTSSSAANKASSPSSVSWAAPSGTDICDRLYYDDSSNATDTAEANTAGPASDPAYQNPGRATVKTYRTGLETATDWTSASAGTGVTMYQPCEVTFTSGMTFTGPVYSRDAVYLSYGTTNGTGPKFVVPAQETLPAVSTGWSTASFPGASAAQLYRPFPYIQGAPSTDSTGYPDTTVQQTNYDLELPTSVSDAAGRAACVYTGPTRIVVSGTTATVISPLTTASTSSACYTNTATGYTSPISATGVTSAQVPIDSTTIYVQNKGTGATSAVASVANPVFSLATPASSTAATTGTPTMSATDAGYVPALLDNPSTHSDGTWAPKWTSYTNVAACLLSSLNLTTPADYAWFNCSIPRGTVNGTSYTNSYSYVKAAIKNALATNPGNYLTASQFAALVNTYVSPGNTSEPASQTWPNDIGYAGRRYAVSAVQDTTSSGCGTTSSSAGTATDVARPTSDKFLSTSSTGHVTPTTTSTVTCLTATVTMQEGMRTSNLNGNLNSCNSTNCGWGDGTNVSTSTTTYSVPQFKVTAKITTPSTQSNTTSTVVSFPDGQDVTQYATWDSTKTNAPGDLYVEGTGISKKLSLVADHDIVITGPLTTTTTTGTNALGENSWTGGGAVSLAAANNVRIYHPVSCAASSATTTAGYCANDITGLYTGALTNSDGSFQATHPAMQYCNLTTGSQANTGNSRCSSSLTGTGTGAVSELDGAVFALNGSLMTDNYNRGLPMGTATVVGGIYQLHRGATGQQWEMPTDASARAYSGYRLQDTYLALESAGLPYVPALKSGKADRSWNIVSVSAG